MSKVRLAVFKTMSYLLRCYSFILIFIGVGNKGEQVSVRPAYAYSNLILPKLAVYASPENLEKMKNELYQTENEEKPSSITALQVK